MVETEKVNQLQSNIPSADVTELNELIYAGAKQIFDEICFRMETEIKKTWMGK